MENHSTLATIVGVMIGQYTNLHNFSLKYLEFRSITIVFVIYQKLKEVVEINFYLAVMGIEFNLSDGVQNHYWFGPHESLYNVKKVKCVEKTISEK